MQLKSFPTFVFDFGAILVSYRNMYFGETSWGSGLTIYPSQTENANHDVVKLKSLWARTIGWWIRKEGNDLNNRLIFQKR